MNRHLLTRPASLLCALLALTALSSASAQNWFGLRSGSTRVEPVHSDEDEALSNGFDLRVSGCATASGGSARFGIGVDAMTTVAAEGPFSVCLGAGPALEFGNGGAWLDI